MSFKKIGGVLVFKSCLPKWLSSWKPIKADCKNGSPLQGMASWGLYPHHNSHYLTATDRRTKRFVLGARENWLDSRSALLYPLTTSYLAFNDAGPAAPRGFLQRVARCPVSHLLPAPVTLFPRNRPRPGAPLRSPRSGPRWTELTRISWGS